MKDCLFCKIISGEIPSHKICETKSFYAFLDIRPINKGHLLAVPKKHCKDLLDFPKGEEEDFVEFVKKVAKAAVQGVKADGFNIGMNNGIAAGQVVFHAHMHIIPRFIDDGLKSWPHKEYTSQELEEHCRKIKSFL